MKKANLDIDISKVTHGYSSALRHLVSRHKPSNLTVVTYTLSEEGIDELNGYVRQKIKLRVLAAKIKRLRDINFQLVVRPSNHAKIWVLDRHYYVGSSNLAGDTITNLMLEVKDREQRKLIEEFVDDLFSDSLIHRTHVI